MAAFDSAPPQPRPHPVSSVPPPSCLDDLALQACDDADSLNEVLRAYTAFEKFIEPGALNDSEALTPSRTELSALLRLLNETLMARIVTVNEAIDAVREALQVKSCAQ